MELTRISKTLSYMLRHSTDPLFVDLNGGWANVNTIITVLKQKHPGFNRETLNLIVAEDSKGRYSFSEDGSRIRANQGHSIPNVVIEMRIAEPPDLLYHGTATRFLDPIMREGLKPMSRQFVHISPDMETAIKTGKRHGTPVVLIISARQFVDDGNELYLSANGVWQAKEVPTKYFEIRYIN